MPRQTRLDDDALIYQPRKKQTEKEKLREMSFHGKFDYIWEYYKFHILGTAAAIALIVYFIYTILHPNPTSQLYVAMINNPIEDQVLTNYNTAFAKQLKLDPKREIIRFNTQINFGVDENYTISLKSALNTYIMAGEVDAIIAPKSQFEDCIKNGYVGKISDKLPTDVYTSLTDKFYITSTEDDSEKSAYGIYLTDTKLYKEHSLSKEPYVLGIVPNAPHEENTIEFVKYLFNEK